MVELPIVDSGRVYYGDPGERGSLTAVDDMSKRILWRQKQAGSPQAFVAGKLVANSNDGLRVINPGTGTIERTLGFLAPLGFAATEDLIVGETFEDEQILFVADFGSGKEIWRWCSGEQSIKCLFAVGPDCICFGLGDGPVCAFSLGSGRELWRESIADLTYNDLGSQRPGQVQGVAIIHEGHVFFEAHRWGVVAFSIKDGKRVWAEPVPGGPYACSMYEGRYYVLSTRGELVVIEPATGKVLSKKALVGKVSKKEMVQPTNPLLISDTHIFTGSHEGYVLAFERETGECVWSHRAKGGGSIGGYFASANGRLYYLDAAFRVYCLAQEG